MAMRSGVRSPNVLAKLNAIAAQPGAGVNELAQLDITAVSADTVRASLGDVPTQLLFPPVVSLLTFTHHARSFCLVTASSGVGEGSLNRVRRPLWQPLPCGQGFPLFKIARDDQTDQQNHNAKAQHPRIKGGSLAHRQFFDIQRGAKGNKGNGARD